MTSSSRRRLLVVEDDPAVATMLAQLLQRLGYEVVAVVETGEDAIQRAKTLQPDLVLMDIVLRGPMDGTEAARQVRLMTNRPVVFVSGHFDAAVLRSAKESEPYGFVLKPFNERDLFVQIEMALGRHQLETERAQMKPRELLAQQNLRELRGLLPICAGCKKIHEEDGRWTTIEDYLGKHAGIELTHSFCPQCENRLYGTHSRPPTLGR